ncbi:recombination regulator RecX [Patescibacteria group bacterium]|nr:recombination regulator RecX [Patescibacteria group bacterium]
MEINKKEEVYSKVYVKVLNFLSFSPRSRKEVLERIDKYFSKINFPSREKDEIKKDIISNLKKDGYLKESNDRDFSILYIEGLKKSRKPFNSLRISQFLSKKGISKDLINELVRDLDQDSIYESVLKDAQKKLRILKSGDAYSKKRKLISYLYRKGYPYDVVKSVVDTLT